jgi:hypothetical protein
MDPWLQAAAADVAGVAGIDAVELELTAADAELLLELARRASHGSGDRKNAPLLCYLAGIAAGRGASLDEIVAKVQ